MDDSDTRAFDGDLPEAPNLVHHVQQLLLLVDTGHLPLPGPHGHVKVDRHESVRRVVVPVGLALTVSRIPLLVGREVYREGGMEGGRWREEMSKAHHTAEGWWIGDQLSHECEALCIPELQRSILVLGHQVIPAV